MEQKNYVSIFIEIVFVPVFVCFLAFSVFLKRKHMGERTRHAGLKTMQMVRAIDKLRPEQGQTTIDQKTNNNDSIDCSCRNHANRKGHL
jgi:predicted SprT family Zn-dependent metalloprotease